MADNVGEALVLLTQLNQKLLSQVKGGNGGKESEFEEAAKPVIVQDFNNAAIEKLKSISGDRVAAASPGIDPEETKKGGGLFSSILTILGIGAGIAGLTVVFGAADKALGFLGDGSSLKSFLTNLGAGLGNFTEGGGLLAIGAMIGAAGVFQIIDNIPGVSVGGLSLSMGIVSIGLGLAGFVSALALSDKLMEMLNTGDPGANISAFMTNLGQGLSSMDPVHLKALGGLTAVGGIFGAIPGVGFKVLGGAALGMSMIGLGLGGFMLGIGTSDKLLSMLNSDSDPGAAISALMKNLSEGLKSFDPVHLKALSGLMAVGGILGAVPGVGIAMAGGAALGMTVIGAGIGGFFLGLGGVEKLLAKMAGETSPGSTIKAMMMNLASGMAGMAGSLSEYTNEQFDKISYAAGKVSAALLKMGGSNLIKAVTDGLASLINFFSGATDPFEFIKELAEDVDQVDLGAKALDNVANALERLSGIDTSLKFDFFGFAKELRDSVPLIEAAIYGHSSRFGTPTKGLANIDAGVRESVDNIRTLQSAFKGVAEEGDRDKFGLIKRFAPKLYEELQNEMQATTTEMSMTEMTREIKDNILLLLESQKGTNTILNTIDQNNTKGNNDIVNAIGSIEFTPLNRGVPNVVASNTRRETLVRDIQANAADQFGTAYA